MIEYLIIMITDRYKLIVAFRRGFWFCYPQYLTAATRLQVRVCLNQKIQRCNQMTEGVRMKRVQLQGGVLLFCGLCASFVFLEQSVEPTAQITLKNSR